MLQHSYCSFPLRNGPFAKQLYISQAINTKPNFLPVSAGKPLLVVSCQMAPKAMESAQRHLVVLDWF